MTTGEVLKLMFISYPSYMYQLDCRTLPDKRCLPNGMGPYQVMMTLHFLNDVAYDLNQHKNYVIIARSSLKRESID